MTTRTSMAGVYMHDKLKFVTLGDSDSGKSSLLVRYTENEFLTECESTIGMDFKFKHICLDGHDVKIQIWDTAGQERFKTITQSYLRGVDGIIFVYDVTNEKSRRNIFTWFEEVKLVNPGHVFNSVLVANKIDLISDEQEKMEILKTARFMAEELGTELINISSAKTNLNVNKSFDSLINKVFHRKCQERINQTKKIQRHSNRFIVIGNLSLKSKDNKCC